MVIYENTQVFGSCFADYALTMGMILVAWFAFFGMIYWARRRRGSRMELRIWKWVGGVVSVLLVAMAIGLAHSDRRSVRVATAGDNLDVIGCVGIDSETTELPLSQVRFEHASYVQSSQKSRRVVHEFQVWTLDKSRQLAKFRADSDGVNMPALRKVAPDAVAAYEKANK